MYHVIEHHYDVVESYNEELYSSCNLNECECYLDIHIRNYVGREVPMKYIISAVRGDVANIIDNYTNIKNSRVDRELKFVYSSPVMCERYVNDYVTILKKYNSNSTKYEKTLYEELDYLFSDFDKIIYCQIPIYPTLKDSKTISLNLYDILQLMWFEYGLSKCWCIASN